MLGLMLVLVLTLMVRLSYGTGFTLDICNNSSQCLPPRNCYDATASSLTNCSSTESSLCVCASKQPFYCNTHVDCPSGELCARTLTTPSSCVSSIAINFSDELFSITDTPPSVPIPSGITSPLWSKIGSKQKGESCSKPLECIVGNFCFSFRMQSGSACLSLDEKCFCIPRGNGRYCNSSADCSDTICTMLDGEPAVCLSNVTISSMNARGTATTVLVNSYTPSNVQTFLSPSIPSQTFQYLQPSTTSRLILANNSVTPSSLPSASKTIMSPQALLSPSSSAKIMSNITDASVSKLFSISAKPWDSHSNTTAPPIVTATLSLSTNSSFGQASFPVQFVSRMPSTMLAERTSSVVESLAASRVAFHKNYSRITQALLNESSEIGSNLDPDSLLASTEPEPSNLDFSLPQPLIDICIASKHLKSMTNALLVYKKDRVAFVLCDKNGSCATPNHIVAYKNRLMMMITYCNMYKPARICISQRALVNSPKYRRGVLIDSQTPNLHFTAHAAKFGTLFEEKFLSTLALFGV